MRFKGSIMRRIEEQRSSKQQHTKPLISVIVPVHNVASFLHRCVDSILSQTYNSLEILLIDDGSQDNSGYICDEYMRRDDRVQVIHKPNGGTVSARECGLSHANGRLVSFIDGDDWIERDMYEKLIDFYFIEKCPEVVSSGLIVERPDRTMSKTLYDGAFEGRYDRENADRKIMPVLFHDSELRQASLLPSVCTKLIERTVAENVMKYMNHALTLGEDGAYVCFLAASSTSIAVLHQAFYHYEQHFGSQNNKLDMEIFSRLFILKQTIIEGLEHLGWYKDGQIQSQIDFYIWDYLRRTCIQNMQIDIDGSVGLFPFARCEPGSIIVVYGAGRVGKDYIRCLLKSKYTEKVIWADKAYKELQNKGYKVVSIEEALKDEYDYIVIAIENEETASSIIKEFLIRGIEQEKIIWEKTVWIDSYDWDNVCI